MRILLDEQLPRRFRREIRGHDVYTAQQQGWSALRNGALLSRAAAAGFEVFVTADQNLPFQQNIAPLPLCVIVLIVPTIKVEHLRPLVPALLEAIREGRPGEIRRVGGP